MFWVTSGGTFFVPTIPEQPVKTHQLRGSPNTRSSKWSPNDCFQLSKISPHPATKENSPGRQKGDGIRATLLLPWECSTHVWEAPPSEAGALSCQLFLLYFSKPIFLLNGFFISFGFCLGSCSDSTPSNWIFYNSFIK